jgi:hypothetical protein
MALIPEVVDAVPKAKPKRTRTRTSYKIRRLPPAVRRDLDRRLAADDYLGFRELSKWLEEAHGQYISPSSLNNYHRNNFDPLLKAVKMAAMQSAEIVHVTSGDDDLMTRALFRLVQTAIFDLLVQLNRTHQLLARMPVSVQHGEAILQKRAARRIEAGETSPGETSPGETSQDTSASSSVSSPAPKSKFSTNTEVAAVTALGRVTATISKAMLDVERWREQMREKLNAQLAATTAKVTEAARKDGMSVETEATIRALLMQIKV